MGLNSATKIYNIFLFMIYMPEYLTLITIIIHDCQPLGCKIRFMINQGLSVINLTS